MPNKLAAKNLSRRSPSKGLALGALGAARIASIPDDWIASAADAAVLERWQGSDRTNDSESDEDVTMPPHDIIARIPAAQRFY